MPSATVEERHDQLKEYAKLKADGADYPDCPRCYGSRTVRAVEDPDAYRPVWEDFPCPLCGSAQGDKDVDDAIEWIREQIEELGGDPDEDSEEEA